MIHLFFFYSVLELAKMIISQGQDIFSGHRQSLYQVLPSYHFSLQDKSKQVSCIFL